MPAAAASASLSTPLAWAGFSGPASGMASLPAARRASMTRLYSAVTSGRLVTSSKRDLGGPWPWLLKALVLSYESMKWSSLARVSVSAARVAP